MKKQTWWVSNDRMTVRVRTVGNMMYDVAPVVRSFRFLDLSELVIWMNKFGKTDVVLLS